MTAFVIPNAIQITTRTTKYTFASFLARDTAHDVIYNIWRLARPEDGLSEDEVAGRPALDAPHPLRTSPPAESGAIPIGPVAPLTRKVTTCACGREGNHYSELALDTVIPGTPERIYNLMFASGFLKDFMRDNQKLEGKFCFIFSLFPTHEYVAQISRYLTGRPCPPTRTASRAICLISNG
jgi:hypothetical protein